MESLIHGGYEFPDVTEDEKPDNAQRDSRQTVFTAPLLAVRL